MIRPIADMIIGRYEYNLWDTYGDRIQAHPPY